MFSPSKGKLVQQVSESKQSNNEVLVEEEDQQKEIRKQYFSMSLIEEDDFLDEGNDGGEPHKEYEEIKIEEVKDADIKQRHHERNFSQNIDENSLNLQYLNSQILNSERIKGPNHNTERESNDALFQYSNISSKHLLGNNIDMSGRAIKHEDPITYQTAQSDQVSEGYHKFQVKAKGT